ncbi:hypothetical protein NSI01_09450 [Pimelobacter simplex]|nr:hypothetical protein NSI01_09450 [Pimelobacter simplex]
MTRPDWIETLRADVRPADPEPALLAQLVELSRGSAVPATRPSRSAGARWAMVLGGAIAVGATSWAAGALPGTDSPFRPEEHVTHQPADPSPGRVGTPQPDDPGSPAEEAPSAPASAGETEPAAPDPSPGAGTDPALVPSAPSGTGSGPPPLIELPTPPTLPPPPLPPVPTAPLPPGLDHAPGPLDQHPGKPAPPLPVPLPVPGDGDQDQPGDLDQQGDLTDSDRDRDVRRSPQPQGAQVARTQ